MDETSSQNDTQPTEFSIWLEEKVKRLCLEVSSRDATIADLRKKLGFQRKDIKNLQEQISSSLATSQYGSMAQQDLRSVFIKETEKPTDTSANKSFADQVAQIDGRLKEVESHQERFSEYMNSNRFEDKSSAVDRLKQLGQAEKDDEDTEAGHKDTNLNQSITPDTSESTPLAARGADVSQESMTRVCDLPDMLPRFREGFDVGSTTCYFQINHLNIQPGPEGMSARFNIAWNPSQCATFRLEIRTGGKELGTVEWNLDAQAAAQYYIKNYFFLSVEGNKESQIVNPTALHQKIGETSEAWQTNAICLFLQDARVDKIIQKRSPKKTLKPAKSSLRALFDRDGPPCDVKIWFTLNEPNEDFLAHKAPIFRFLLRSRVSTFSHLSDRTVSAVSPSQVSAGPLTDDLPQESTVTDRRHNNTLVEEGLKQTKAARSNNTSRISGTVLNQNYSIHPQTLKDLTELENGVSGSVLEEEKEKW